MTAAGRPKGLIRDPRSCPVIGIDDHLPPVPADRLQVDVLRRRLSRAHEQTVPLQGDGQREDLYIDRPLRRAAVLVPMVCRPDGLRVLLTRRADHLHDHAGQISFPGGRCDAQDADAVATALREAWEEVGLAARHVEVIGRMPDYTTVTRYVVTPVIGLVSPDHALRLDAFEVAEAFEVPLSHLMNPAHHQRHQLEVSPGVRRQFLSMPWRLSPKDENERFIWGATAAMLRNLYQLLID